MEKVPKNKQQGKKHPGNPEENLLFTGEDNFLNLSKAQIQYLQKNFAKCSCQKWNNVRRKKEIDAFKHKLTPAGYTYLGQFIAHDLSFVSFRGQSRRGAIKNQVTPMLDLDGLYGRGPLADPLFYSTAAQKTGYFAYSKAPQDLRRLARDQGALELPIIPDARNDDNIFISQIHLAFQKLHNQLLTYVALQRVYNELALEVFFKNYYGNPDRKTKDRPERDVSKLKHGTNSLHNEQLTTVRDFERARHLVTQIYHWIILEDYLPRLIPKYILEDMLGSESAVEGQLKWYTKNKRHKIPLEFSLACFRFGHSMVRSSYRFKKVGKGASTWEEVKKLFTVKTNGQRVSDLTIDWASMFQDDFSTGQNANPINLTITNQMKEEIGKIDGTNQSIVERNLTAGNGRLLSGQEIARLMGLTPLRCAVKEEDFEVDPAKVDPNDLPLWVYTLLESDKYYDGVKLGPVAGRIVAEVLIGLLINDPTGYLNRQPHWTPCDEDFNQKCTCHKGKNHPDYEGKCNYSMIDFLKFAGVYESQA
ncbi:MAG TPA: peroxidase family protein [Saprospiraceae bacterium]|nr:peroxidase family protein [Saprospiraceae bacterium]